ncbi:MAG: hypothetical protein ABIP38_05375, partial [Steroidobacteraceae bacterium]
ELLWWSVPVLGVLLAMVGRRCSARASALVSAAALLVVAAAFVSGNRVAASRVDAMAQAHFQGMTTLDKVLSPNPTNPFCWDVLLVQAGGGRYVVRHGLLSIAVPPRAAGCSQLLARPGTAPMTAVPAPASRQMLWLGEFSGTTDSLIELVDNDCAARELMQFVRAPFATVVERHYVIGDLRFDREAGIGMSELVVDPERPGSCRHFVPWTSPRADLLSEASAR